MLDKPLVIAELSGNHNGSIEEAFKLIKDAARVGCSGVKLQTFHPEEITLNSRREDFLVKGGNWDGFSLYELYNQTFTPWDWHLPIKKLCDELNLLFISTPFHESAVNFLVELGVDYLKIASPELNHLPLIEHCSKTGKPIIISTGMGTLDEIKSAINSAKKFLSKDITVLKCTSAYPTPLSEINLQGMLTIKNNFNVKVGLSDHSQSPMPATLATILGASMIEKHIVSNRSAGGIDSHFSSEPEEFMELINNIKLAKSIFGSGKIKPSQSESISRNHRRSIYAKRNIEKGKLISYDDVGIFRPGFGEEPKNIEKMIGKRCKKFIPFANPIFLEDLI